VNLGRRERTGLHSIFILEAWQSIAEESSRSGTIPALQCTARCPEVTPDVFPRYWNTSEHLPWALPQRIQLGDYEILAAFDNLVSNGDVYSDHHFCFFIDGLDEFEESSQHRDLVAKFEKWIGFLRAA
jgi:hypothetical protein